MGMAAFVMVDLSVTGNIPGRKGEAYNMRTDTEENDTCADRCRMVEVSKEGHFFHFTRKGHTEGQEL